MRSVAYAFCLIVFAVLISCAGNRIYSIADYLKWLNEPSNGLVKIRSVNGIEIKMKYLPAEYQAWKEISNEPGYSVSQRDSILNLYRNSLSFLFSIGPDEKNGVEGDIMFNSVENYSQYKERVYDMNFFFGEKITLKAGEKEYKPVLTSMENIYGIGPSRNIILVFVPAEKEDNNMKESDQLQLEYEDDTYALGTNRFVFSRKDINNAPRISLISI